VSYSVLHIDDAERIAGHGFAWRPLRKALGTTAFGVNAYTSDAGDEVIEDHDELSAGAGGHEELYVVLQGSATFTVDGDEVAAPAGTLLVVPPGTRRGAIAAEDGTTVMVIGGVPGAAGPRTPFEYWYEAEPHYRSGDYARAVAIASEGLADWPEHPSLNYQLACYEALQGRREQAIAHLRIAFAGNPDTREWAAGDEDLESVRDDPALA
jgi:tetratricopeptide (TPR) repeat protein